jgi:cytochrome c nitrite reductase small subunit
VIPRTASTTIYTLVCIALRHRNHTNLGRPAAQFYGRDRIRVAASAPAVGSYDSMTRSDRFLAIVVGLLAIPIGSALHTFEYAEGASYLSDAPSACANCHVMQETFDDWSRGEHAHAATCADCHVPRDFVGKWYTKAENGWAHSLAMTLGAVPANIAARPVSRRIALDNCVSCHSRLLDETLHASGDSDEQLNCLQCHRSIGHPH